MTDITEQILPRLKEHRLAEIALSEEFIHPYYEGLSILNIPDSICRWLGVPTLGHGPILPEVLEAVDLGAPRRVVLLVVDALGLSSFEKYAGLADHMPWGRMVDLGVLAALTSIVPSTTSAALNTLWSGRSPAEHGVVGYEMWLKEYGLVANMIRHSPMSFEGGPGSAGSLSMAGFRPEDFMIWPTLGTHLAGHGVKSFAFQHASISFSGLSRMFFKDVEIRPFSTGSDLWVNLRELLERQPNERLFAWAYWGDVDLLSHLYGPGDERTQAEFISFSQSFQRLFLDRLSSAARQDTLFLLTADHGQVHTPPDPHYDLGSHPNLARRLNIFPTGEHRLTYLYIRPSQQEAVREYIERTWHGQFQLLDPGHAASAGLLGPGQPHTRLRDRVGDLMVASRGRAYLWWGAHENRLLGRHGGLSQDEMVVPFLASRLDA